jgi:DNA helicase-2/ATP-dependent DNA helicase PcrA
MALESFRQLILDAQAMMDPDFAGKLSADVAASAESAEDADTGFEFGAAEDSASADSEASFNFGAGEDTAQLPLLDAASFSPFAAA